jgi:hypothetical protein
LLAQDFACGLKRPQDGSSSNPAVPTKKNPTTLIEIEDLPAEGQMLRFGSFQILRGPVAGNIWVDFELSGTKQ